MQKHDKMVALAKEKSAEMTETAITAIETMYRKNIKISVAELTKLTGLSRGFFYNNPNVKQVMMELKEKQQGMILRNPKSDAIAKASLLGFRNIIPCCFSFNSIMTCFTFGLL